MVERYVKSDDNNKVLYLDANNLYGHSMSQSIPFDENKFERNVCLPDTLKIPDDSDIGYLLEVG